MHALCLTGHVLIQYTEIILGALVSGVLVFLRYRDFGEFLVTVVSTLFVIRPYFFLFLFLQGCMVEATESERRRRLSHNLGLLYTSYHCRPLWSVTSSLPLRFLKLSRSSSSGCKALRYCIGITVIFVVCFGLRVLPFLLALFLVVCLAG